MDTIQISPSDLKLPEIFWGNSNGKTWKSQGGVLGKICEIRVDDLEIYMSDVYHLICSLWLDDPTEGASALEPISCVF